MTQEQWLRWVSLAVFVVGMGISMRYRYKSEQGREKIPWRGEGWFVMVCLRVFGMLMWLTLLTYFIYPPAVAWAQVKGLPLWLRWAGVGVAVCMVPCLAWMFHSIGKNITQTVELREGHQLVTHGPYRWIRHPLYSFGMLNFFAYAVIAANWLLALWMVLGLVMLLIRLPKEEEKLIEGFGQEYVDYKARTGALFPKLW